MSTNYGLFAKSLHREAAFQRDRRGQSTLATELDEAASAIETLLSQLKPPNDPLTLDELREMDGEPVWVVSINPLWTFDPCWMLVSGKPEILRDVNTEWLDFKRYGKSWLAYRRKPEEGEIWQQ